MSEEYEKYYYKNEEMDCTNCKHSSKRLFIFSYCEMYPNWLQSDALSHCKLEEWVPNKKLYLKDE